MKTKFYKILYKNKDVVYVGVTTRAITERFKEHIISKGLNKNYSVVEFDCMEHSQLCSLEVYYAEKRKVAELEQKYIKEELEKGSRLLNISKGGEWGSQILEKLRKEEFGKKFGSYDKYAEYKKKIDKSRGWIENWVECKSVNKSKFWLYGWIRHRSEVRVKRWVQRWVECKSTNRLKRFLYHWIQHRGTSKTKIWMRNWVLNRSQVKTKVWVTSWIQHRGTSKTKIWMRNWVNCRTRNKVKVWMRNWVAHRK